MSPARIPPVVDQAIETGGKAVWMQLGIVHEAAAQKAGEAGIAVVMDRCTKQEHERMTRSSEENRPFWRLLENDQMQGLRNSEE